MTTVVVPLLAFLRFIFVFFRSFKALHSPLVRLSFGFVNVASEKSSLTSSKELSRAQYELCNWWFPVKFDMKGMRFLSFANINSSRPIEFVFQTH